jgi:SAM-dependent methyltransferase
MDDDRERAMSAIRESVVEQVREKYGAVAASTLSNDAAGVQAVAEAFGYSPEELASLPADANMGLSCGNPTATAHLRPGEVVVDLGCGGGIDVLLAARKVGPTGRAIGIDMTPEMIERANRNAEQLRAKGEPINVEFHLARMESLPLPDASVDVLISNCVINLAPDKPAVFREMVRVLKPGGRVAVSDIALKKELPAGLADSVAAYVGCVAGALPIAEYVRQLTTAGFTGVQVIDARKDLNAYSKIEGQSGCCSPATAGQPGCCTPTAVSVDPCCTPAQAAGNEGSCCGSEPPTDVHAGLADLLARYDVNEYAASVQVFAIKPRV